MITAGLTSSFLTLAGADYDKEPAHGMLSRAIAAHAAGFDSMGININEECDSSALAYVKTPEAEWIDLDRDDSHIRECITKLDKLQRVMGITRVNVGVCVPDKVSWPDLVRRLRMLADTGLTVAFEPVAFGSMSSVYECSCVINLVNRPNVGLLHDVWHVWHDNASYAWGSPECPIAEIQICGIPRQMPAGRRHILAASQDRPYIHESHVGIMGWLKLLRDEGITAPVSVENPTAICRADLHAQVSRIRADIESL